MKKNTNKYFEGLSSKISSSISTLNSSKYVTGLIVLFLNVGSRYVDFGFSKNQEYLLKSAFTRELMLYSGLFMATRDLVLSFILTASFIVMANYVFNEESRFCIMPEKMDKIKNLVDTNGDGIVSEKEEQEAIKILTKAKEQKEQKEEKMMQNNFTTNLLK